MFFFPFHSIVVRAINSLNLKININLFLAFATAGILSGTASLLIYVSYWHEENLKLAGYTLLAVGFSLFYVIVCFLDAEALNLQQAEIFSAQELAHDNPEKPQFAWELARVKLESYLDRNLKQVNSIFWLTSLVMLSGFSFIMYGLYHAVKNPDKLPVSIVAASSGVIISFIGGSLLLIYRSILAQTKTYVSVLERINAVGMAVHVIESIPNEDTEKKNLSKAELAKQLLTLYSNR